MQLHPNFQVNDYNEYKQEEGNFSQPVILLAGCILRLHRKTQSLYYLY